MHRGSIHISIIIVVKSHHTMTVSSMMMITINAHHYDIIMRHQITENQVCYGFKWKFYTIVWTLIVWRAKFKLKKYVYYNTSEKFQNTRSRNVLSCWNIGLQKCMKLLISILFIGEPTSQIKYIWFVEYWFDTNTVYGYIYQDILY